MSRCKDPNPQNIPVRTSDAERIRAAFLGCADQRKAELNPALAAPYGAHSARLHSTAESAPVARQQPRPRFDLGQRVWFVRGRGKALQPHEGHIGQYGRVDGRKWLGDCWVYEVRCRGRLDVVDEECLTQCYADHE